MDHSWSRSCLVRWQSRWLLHRPAGAGCHARDAPVLSRASDEFLVGDFLGGPRLRIHLPPAESYANHRFLGVRCAGVRNCGADGWAMTPSGVRGVLNDATSIYFADATLA